MMKWFRSVLAVALIGAFLVMDVGAASAIPPTVPGAPTVGTATAGQAQATLTWTAPADDGGSPITSYTAVSTPGNKTATTADGSTLSVTIGGLTNGTAYTFTVHANNSVGSSPESASSAAVTPATVPDAPTMTVGAATAGDGTATLAWSAPTSDGGSAVTSYTVVSHPGSHTVTTANGTTLSATVSGLTNGLAYTFTVYATNDVGDGLESLPSTPLIPAVPTAPGTPLLVTGTAGQAQASVSWTAPNSDGGSPILSYTVTASPGGQTATTPNGATLSATVSGLTNGVTYTFTVHATNSVGSSLESLPSDPVTPVATVPGAPTIGSATPGNTTATITWSAPASDGGTPVTSYTVTSSPGGYTATTADGTTLSATVTGLTNGTAYTFTVHATNSVGNSAESGASTAVTPRTVPGVPTGVSAGAGDKSATVTWAAPGANGGSSVTSYSVTAYRGATASTTVTATGTSTTVTGLTNGVSYTFKVAATNDAGTGPASASSNAITPAAAADPAVIGAKVRSGYWMVGLDGTVYAFGDAKWLGNATTSSAVDLEPTPSGNGYWVIDNQGRVSTFGDATGHGNVDLSRLSLGERTTSLSATPSGKGYWVFTTKGRALPFGDAVFLGDMSAVTLNGPVLDSIPTPSGQGYYMVAADGGIFAFGDARFAGSMGGKKLNAPVQSLVPDSDGAGYWLVASDGGIFAFEAPFKGSMGATPLNKPVTGMVRFGSGYLMVAEDGGIFNYSDRPFFGSLGGNPPARPIVSVAVLEG